MSKIKCNLCGNYQLALKCIVVNKSFSFCCKMCVTWDEYYASFRRKEPGKATLEDHSKYRESQ